MIGEPLMMGSRPSGTHYLHIKATSPAGRSLSDMELPQGPAASLGSGLAIFCLIASICCVIVEFMYVIVDIWKFGKLEQRKG
jgi:hypothetical protein